MEHKPGVVRIYCSLHWLGIIAWVWKPFNCFNFSISQFQSLEFTFYILEFTF